MEDNKKNNIHALNSVKKEAVVPEQPSYEQLKYWLDKAIDDNRNLVRQLNEVTNSLAYMPWLFKVLEFKDTFNSNFVTQCVNSITEFLTFDTQSQEENNKSSK